MFDAEDLATIREAKSEWEADTLEATLDRFGERKETFETDTEGQSVDRIYTPDDIADLDYTNDLGFPGEEPYTRGVYPTMHRGRLWTMRKYAGMGTAQETNERFNYLIDQGSSGLSMAFDLPTQMGTIRTPRWPLGRSERPGSPSTRWRTSRPSSTEFRSMRSRPA